MSSTYRYQGAPYSFTLPFNLAVESSNVYFYKTSMCIALIRMDDVELSWILRGVQDPLISPTRGKVEM